jgi:hypothetical protein
MMDRILDEGDACLTICESGYCFFQRESYLFKKPFELNSLMFGLKGDHVFNFNYGNHHYGVVTYLTN